MSKNHLNIWDWKHPFRSIKYAYWRITKGFCPSDTWDWYAYMALFIHDSLYYLADNHCGTMYEYIDKDLEYTDKLKEIANKILDATNYEEEYDNPFREDYYKDLENMYTENRKVRFDKTNKALFEHYIFVEQKNAEKAKNDLKEAFGWIIDHWWELWD